MKKILLQHSVLGDLYFPKHKLAVQVDEKGQTGTDERKENARHGKIKEELDCKFNRINPDERDYDEYGKFGEINNHISESNKKSTKKSTKKSLIDDLSKRLLELKFEENQSIKSKCLKFIVKKVLPSL